MIGEAQRFWDAIVGKVRKVAQDESKNAFRCERYEVTTAPNGSKIGVTLPLGSKEIFLPYSSEVEEATVGSQVLVVWWGSMSNAKVYYYADGYRGCIFPIGYVYESTLPTSPAALFGGTWEQIKDVFTLAAGDTYTAGSTGGEAKHALALSEMPSHRHRVAVRGYAADTSTDAITNAAYSYTVGGQVGWAGTINEPTGGGAAHNNMPPYLVVYKWKRVA